MTILTAPPCSTQGTPISLDQVLAHFERRLFCVAGTEAVSLRQAAGRVLATDILAQRSLPPADNAAMDGYAIRHADLGKGEPTWLRVVGVASAGHPYDRRLEPAQAIRIFTGARMPAGADTVVMQEMARQQGDLVSIPIVTRPGQHCRRAGEDVRAGSRLLAAGTRLTPMAIGLLAAQGVAAVSVRRPLRVGLFSSGDELVEAADALPPGKLNDANRPMLLAALTALGMEARDLGILPDDHDAVARRLADQAGCCDVLIGSGGMSVGAADHLRAAARDAGRLEAWDVAIKPGHPIGVGRIGLAPFFGLPGNPVAAMVTFLMIARPALQRLAGQIATPTRRFPVPVAAAISRKRGRREFLRCALEMREAGSMAARPLPSGAGMLSVLAGCDGFLDLAEDVAEVPAGVMLPFIPMTEFGL